jgi:hypothetical protein
MRIPSVRSLVLTFVLFCTVMTSSELAQARTYSSGAPNSITDTSTHSRDTDLSLMLWLPWYYGFGVGAVVRYEIPVLPDGFIPSINDEFSLEPNLGIAVSNCCGASWVSLSPALYGDWSFNFSKEFRAYVGLGLGINIGFYSGAVQGLNYDYFFWDLCFGIFYRFNPAIAFRAEIGSQGLKLGVAFFF